HPRVVLGRYQLGHVPAQHLVATVAERLLAALVDRGEPALEIESVNDVVGVLEQVAVAGFALAQLGLDAFAAADVLGWSGDLDEAAGDSTRLVPEGGAAEAEAGLLGLAVPLDDERYVLHDGSQAGVEDVLEQRPDRAPDLGPALPTGSSQPGRVPVAQE